MRILIDPPGGWKCGFPREYDGEPGGEINEWLLKKGYPQAEIDQWQGKPVPVQVTHLDEEDQA